MLLRDLIYSLETGELHNLSIVDTETETIKPQHYGRIVTSANLGVTDLHTRFLIKKGSLSVTLKEDQVVYPLQQRFVIGATPKPDQFITTEYGMKDMLKILEVRDDHHNILPLNTGDPRRGINTPSFNTLAVSSDLYKEWNTRHLTVDFQRNGKLIPTCDTEYDPDCLVVDIDMRYLNALSLFIASRLHNPSGFGTDGVHEGNNYHTLYLEECARLSNTGQNIAESFFGSHKLRKGFP
jgi:hypothetical protein